MSISIEASQQRYQSEARNVPVVDELGIEWFDPGRISKDKVRAHDQFFIDRLDGKWLTPSQVADQVTKLSSWYVGETPEGKRVFGIVPPIRAHRHLSAATIPLGADVSITAYNFARDLGHAKAVVRFLQRGVIGYEQAEREMGGIDPFLALENLENRRTAWRDTVTRHKYEQKTNPQKLQREIVDHKPAKKNTSSQPYLPPIGTAVTTSLLASAVKTPTKDSQGRKFRSISNAVYYTSTGLVTGSLILSACAPVTPDIKPAFVLTRTKADTVVQPWLNVDIPLGNNELGQIVVPIELQTDPADPSGESLVTLSRLNTDGKTVRPDVSWAMGLATVKNKQTHELESLPILIQFDKQGQTLVMGLFLNPEVSNSTHGEFTVNILNNGKISPTTLRVLVDMVGSGLSLKLYETDTGNSSQLVQTPTAVPTSPTAVPTDVPKFKWIDTVIGILTGAKAVYAQGAEVTPIPPATPTEILESTATVSPTPTEAPIVLDEEYTTAKIPENLKDVWEQAPKEHTTTWGEKTVAAYYERINRIVYVTKDNKVVGMYNDGYNKIEKLPQGINYMFGYDNVWVFTTDSKNSVYIRRLDANTEDPNGGIIYLGTMRAYLWASYKAAQKPPIPLEEGDNKDEYYNPMYFVTGEGAHYFDPANKGKYTFTYNSHGVDVTVDLSDPIFIYGDASHSDYKPALVVLADGSLGYGRHNDEGDRGVRSVINYSLTLIDTDWNTGDMSTIDSKYLEYIYYRDYIGKKAKLISEVNGPSQNNMRYWTKIGKK
ncbi:MAG: hypothetical protein UV61_C0030G0008 [Candidatus Gottesmanbacteria bacterium GW2011_GWB1_43_11]|uniref:Uncharacterized protein n=1 Tax=Candidatus Gottesmanbacteria bacterium GW2011_GWB1_43_11 TaxID=1618446 RepID=A0A0G1CG21_9BACT|nr:MAG: hypothetical protein UV17_C0048G0006 [Candidatus Gottesmanbacteria bacterium GW2011_GWA1_42_26]KKS84424.1 MAG: hypothetical protein UV61_C0030G0008 [Candidatus Gottesmanbacteria bacterium GW2011_GWB1_43_11]OGG08725.1 MAG: hypothetical protein A2699_04070 [Candidatus Gottesmanbacteria bacterium RIFCSPHIGHO2_01_FULL_43_15]HCM37055.1 hypothetical protein [Patescibacteria group bacterium]